MHTFFNFLACRRDLCKCTVEFPVIYQSLHWLREMPTKKTFTKIIENLKGSAEWLRMPTRCCKYQKSAYADSVGVAFLTNSFHGKKKKRSSSVRRRSLGRRPHTWEYQIQIFWSIQRFGAMAGGSEMPPSLDCTL